MDDLRLLHPDLPRFLCEVIHGNRCWEVIQLESWTSWDAGLASDIEAGHELPHGDVPLDQKSG